ncbi:cyanovirin-N homolog [Selaginella moellendorffii]|nr:cyanovirin-N homolog [Selaginella moellendorffii]|eukprot:XP_024521273.1 cyanovirin-N homolog [Selaginella moellendorffii]
MAPRLLTLLILVVVTLGVIEAQCDFSRSCSGITYGGSTLIANCVNQAGATVRSQIDLNTCVGNNNGQLDCSSGYFQSCAGVQYSGTTVSATCPSVSNQPIFSSRDLNSCVRNSNGNLECC